MRRPTLAFATTELVDIIKPDYALGMPSRYHVTK